MTPFQLRRKFYIAFVGCMDYLMTHEIVDFLAAIFVAFVSHYLIQRDIIASVVPRLEKSNFLFFLAQTTRGRMAD